MAPRAAAELSSIHRYPDYSQHLAEFKRQTVGLDEWEQLSEDERESYYDEFDDEWFPLHLDEWEDNTRNALSNVDELTITSQYPEIENTTVSVRVE